MEDSSTGVTTPSLITTVGLVLAPVVGVLIVIELVMVVSQVSYFAHLASYPAHPNGISESGSHPPCHRVLMVRPDQIEDE